MKMVLLFLALFLLVSSSVVQAEKLSYRSVGKGAYAYAYEEQCDS
jgi:hypothetical protein